MAKLVVQRKAYKRKAYTRKDGTRVSASKVGSSQFKVKDRGKRGRTPKSQQFYEPKVEMGWHKEQSEGTRRRLALKSHRGNNLSTARALQALANVTVDSSTRARARADSQYFYAQHRKTGK